MFVVTALPAWQNTPIYFRQQCSKYQFNDRVIQLKLPFKNICPDFVDSCYDARANSRLRRNDSNFVVSCARVCTRSQSNELYVDVILAIYLQTRARKLFLFVWEIHITRLITSPSTQIFKDIMQKVVVIDFFIHVFSTRKNIYDQLHTTFQTCSY